MRVCLSYSSEANDLALRLAQQYTQHEDVIVLDQCVCCLNATQSPRRTLVMSITANSSSTLALTTGI